MKMGDFDNWKAKYLEYTDAIIRYIPYRKVAEWKEFGLDPLSKVSKPDSIMERVKDIYAMQLIGLVIGFLAALPALAIYAVLLVLWSALLVGIPLIFIAMFFVVAIVIFLINPVFSLLYCLVEYAVAKLLGGTADFNAHFNSGVASGLAAFALQLPLQVANIPITWLRMVPIISCLGLIIFIPVGLAMLGVYIYGIYLRFICYRKIHNLSDGKAAAVIIMPIVISLVVVIAIFVLFYAMIFAAMLAPLLAAGGAGAGGAGA